MTPAAQGDHPMPPALGAARNEFEGRLRALLVASVLSGAGGFAVQLFQTVDPTPAYFYFSPLVALLVGSLALVRLVEPKKTRSPGLMWCFDASVGGVTLASAVYWLGIVPVNGLAPIQDPYSFTAALMIHIATPLASVGAFALTVRLDAGRRWWVWGAPALLVVYSVLILPIVLVTDRALPYEFVDPTVVGPWLAMSFFCLSVVVALCVSWALLRLRLRFQAQSAS